MTIDTKHSWLLLLVVPCVAVVLFAFGERGDARPVDPAAPPTRVTLVAPASPREVPLAAQADVAVSAPSPAREASEDDAHAADAIEAMVRAGEVGAARTATYAFFKRYPKSPRGAELEALTGMHRPPPTPKS